MTDPHYTDESVTLFHGDCLDVLRELPDASVDAVVTDPPYELAFMGRHWDASGIAFRPDVWAECLRVLKPGGHLLAFGGSRTWHRLTCAVEDAGFEIRDSIAWLYGSGFPKSLDVSKAIDKAAGAEREVLGINTEAARRNPNGVGGNMRLGGCSTVTELEALADAGANTPDGRNTAAATLARYRDTAKLHALTAPATPDAERWQGWGTALKPAFEPIVVGRKPLAGTVAGNVLAYGTGALNIDATRVQPPDSAGSSHGDNTVCTCPSREGAQTSRTQNTPRPVSSDGAHGDRSALPANARLNENGNRPLLDSQDDCLSSPRSGDAPVRGVPEDAQASALRPPDAHTSHARCATCGGNRLNPSTPYPDFTAPNVESLGRWPANVVLDESQAAELDKQSGPVGSWSGNPNRADGTRSDAGIYSPGSSGGETIYENRGGGASRFFPTFKYEPKAPTTERPRDGQTAHPTVKPLDLMRWLVRLVTPPGGIVLEPFAGSGTTAEACVVEGFNCIAIEREADYLPLIVQRLSKPIQVALDFDSL